MRAAAGSGSGDPIVVRFFETLEGPAPGFQALGGILRHGGVVWPVGTAWRGFIHEGLRAAVLLADSSRNGMPRELAEEKLAMTMYRHSQAFALAGCRAFA